MSNLDNYSFSTRNDYKDFIVDIEKRFPVNNWKFNSIHIWPIIRINLFFYLINKYENKDANVIVNDNTSPVKLSFLKKIKSKLYHIKKLLEFNNVLKSTSKKDKVYFGANSHRVTEGDFFFNRFFDAQRILDKDNTSYIYFEYIYDHSKKYYNPSNIFNYKQYLTSFVNLKKKAVKVDLDSYEDFLAYLSQDASFDVFVKNWDIVAVHKKANEYSVVIDFFTLIYKKIQPKEISYLCYYNSTDVLLSVAAANKLGIPTKEMQHGPQTEIHLAYGSWSNVPHEGYDMLPRTFLHWEPSTSDILQKWMQKNSLYKTVVVGHPWIEYLSQSYNTKIEEPFILYCLQPAPVTIEETFPTPLIEHIKQGNIKWYIRLHPRQMESYEDIKSFLSNNGLDAYVNLDDATQLPLPVLIKNTKAVVTLFSGSVLEAEMMNKPSIILSEIGRMNFKSQIEAGSAVYIDPTDLQFESRLNEFILNYKKT